MAVAHCENSYEKYDIFSTTDAILAPFAQYRSIIFILTYRKVNFSNILAGIFNWGGLGFLRSNLNYFICQFEELVHYTTKMLKIISIQVST